MDAQRPGSTIDPQPDKRGLWCDSVLRSCIAVSMRFSSVRTSICLFDAGDAVVAREGVLLPVRRTRRTTRCRASRRDLLWSERTWVCAHAPYAHLQVKRSPVLLWPCVCPCAVIVSLCSDDCFRRINELEKERIACSTDVPRWYRASWQVFEASLVEYADVPDDVSLPMQWVIDKARAHFSTVCCAEVQ